MQTRINPFCQLVTNPKNTGAEISAFLDEEKSDTNSPDTQNYQSFQEITAFHEQNLRSIFTAKVLFELELANNAIERDSNTFMLYQRNLEEFSLAISLLIGRYLNSFTQQADATLLNKGLAHFDFYLNSITTIPDDAITTRFKELKYQLIINICHIYWNLSGINSDKGFEFFQQEKYHEALGIFCLGIGYMNSILNNTRMVIDAPNTGHLIQSAAIACMNIFEHNKYIIECYNQIDCADLADILILKNAQLHLDFKDIFELAIQEYEKLNTLDEADQKSYQNIRRAYVESCVHEYKQHETFQKKSQLLVIADINEIAPTSPPVKTTKHFSLFKSKSEKAKEKSTNPTPSVSCCTIS